MADIAAVLKKTIEGLPRHDAGIRAKVYDKARAQIKAKLLAAKPDADRSVIDRNMAVVERAIRAVEDDYRFQDELGDVLGTEEAQRIQSASAEPAPEPVFDNRQADEPEPVSPPEETLYDDPSSDEPTARPDTGSAYVDDPVFSEMIGEGKASPPPPPADAPELANAAPELTPEPFEQEMPRADEPTSPLDEVTADTSDTVMVAPLHDGADHDSRLTEPAEPDADTSERPEEQSRVADRRPAERKPRRWGVIAAALIVLLLAGGLGAAAYFVPEFGDEQIAAIEDTFDGLLGDDAGSAIDAPADSASDTVSPTDADTDQTRPEKFTQRLSPDGSESDAGPAGEPVDEFGEGTSVAPLTVARADAEQEGQPTDSAAAENPQDDAQAQPAVQVGQRAIYSEERTANEELRRLQGSVVWSKVQEQPGPDMEVEPALRADLYIPDTGTSMRMTMRRNGDRSLPASHVIEVIFEPTTQEPGRSVRNILRMMFKESEAAPGNPLNAFPAEIGSNFFLMMLDEGQQARQANLELIRNRDWIDLLVILEAGRRALFTMEKGLPGTDVVDEVLDYWQQNPLADS
ncbi:hypothetical protein B7H23_06975 [Notoacmeibacter marinus]|uniref:Uncharacterized protein n=1 Tax=Notoacmeibacter marinus TaxID=1876515 RepID=A0A231V394_9HYPH|nr:hypothetical protein [Notoacmeibacter marinus]OXT02624.1 hypothetical protein B7H23_06975 [Notoacmeibacter marinus]